MFFANNPKRERRFHSTCLHEKRHLEHLLFPTVVANIASTIDVAIDIAIATIIVIIVVIAITVMAFCQVLKIQGAVPFVKTNLPHMAIR